MESELAVFWSYAHEDNNGDRGRILKLAEHIRSEFELVSGQRVRLFVDAKSLRWGDDWRNHIENELNASTFFIPILTPRYFDRPECRRELTDFYGQAEGRGLGKLILPILYARVAGLEEESPDELLALSARTQYVDWTGLRLADPDSERYRIAINSIVIALVDRWTEMRDVEAQNLVAASTLEDPAEWGLAEALEEINRRLATWLDLVEDDPVVRAQAQAIQAAYSERKGRASRQQHLAIEHRMISELLPLEHRELEFAKAYSALTIEMHPFVLTALRAARLAPEARPALEPLGNAVMVAKRAIDILDAASPDTKWMGTYWQERQQLGLKFREMYDLDSKIKEFKVEGNTLVRAWISELKDLGLLPQSR